MNGNALPSATGIGLAGKVAMTAGVGALVLNSLVKATSIAVATAENTNVNAGFLIVALADGTLTIASSNALDARTVHYIVVNPTP